MLHSAKSLPLVTQGEPMLSSLFGWLSTAFSPQSSSVHRRRLHHSMLLLVATILLATGLASPLQDNHKSQNLCSGFPQNILTIGFIQLTNDKPLFVIANDLKVYGLNVSNLSMNVDLPVELDAWRYPVWKELVKAIKAKQDAMNNSVIFQFRKNDTDNNSVTSFATWLIHNGNKALFNWLSSKYGRGEQQIECKQADVDICKHNFVWILNDMPFILSDDGKKMFQFEIVVKDDNNKVSLDLRNGSQRNICSTQDKDGFSVKFTTANCNGSEVNWKVQKGFAYDGKFYFFDADKVRIVAMNSYNTSDSVKVDSVDYGTFFNCSKEPETTTTSTLAPNVTQSDPATATDIITSRSTPSTNMSTSMSSESFTNQTMSTDNLTTIAIDESTTEASNWTLVIVLSLVIVIVAIILIGGIVYYCYFYRTSTAKPKCNNNKSAKPKEKQDSTKKVQSTLEVKDGGSDVAKVESFGALRSDILLEEDIAVPSKSDMDWLSTSKAASAPAVAAKQQAKAAVLGKKQSKQSIVGGNEAKHHAISPKAATSHKNRAHEPDSARFGAKNSRSKSVTVLPVATNLSTQAPVSIRSAD